MSERIRAGLVAWLVACATCAACVAGVVGGPGSAAAAADAGWTRRDFESPLGDRASGIAVDAEREPGFALVIGCDGERGDRWRGAVVLQKPEDKRELEEPVGGPVARQRVQLALGDGRPVSDTFEVRRNAAGARLFGIPEPSKFVRRLLEEQKRAPASKLRLELSLANGKPLKLIFPLSGLDTAFADLSKRCRDWEP